MDNLIILIIELNKNHHMAFAFLTVAIVVSVGSTMATIIELFFAIVHGKSRREG